MHVKTIVDEDFANYKKPAMLVGTVSCTGKCCIEAGLPLSTCQNNVLHTATTVSIPDKEICERYMKNKISKAIVFGGLEPFDQFDEVYCLISMLRYYYGCKDDVVIYTGYRPEEVPHFVEELKRLKNVVIKFGRFTPGDEKHRDHTLGVDLASDGQWAERIC